MKRTRLTGSATLTWMVAGCVMLAGGRTACGESRYEKWQKDRPFTQTAWYGGVIRDLQGTAGPAVSLPPAWPLPNMDLYRRSGLNLVTDVSAFLGTPPEQPGQGYPAIAQAQAAGVPYFISLHSDTDIERFKWVVGYLADDTKWDGFAGIYIGDERSPDKDAKLWQMMIEYTAYGRKRWPQLIYLAGHATSPENGLTQHLRQVLDRYAKEIRPDVYIHQFYPFHWSLDGRVRSEWYHIMEYYGQFAKRTGTGFWSYPQTGVKRMPLSESALRLEKFGALAYGVQGFMDFGYDLFYYNEPRYRPPSVNNIQYVNFLKLPDGNLTEMPTEYFPVHAQINWEVANIAGSLIRLRHVRTYHVDEVPPYRSSDLELSVHPFNTKDRIRTGKLMDVKGLGGESHKEDGVWRASAPLNSLMVGFFRDEADQEYFMVVNKEVMTETERPIGEPPAEGKLPGENWSSTDPRAIQQVTLTFDDSVGAIQRLSRLSGRIEDIELTDHQFTFELPGGTGELFKYNTGQAFAGVQ